jgi:hypothetical protein
MMLYAIIDTNSNVYGFIKLCMHFCLYVFLPYLAFVFVVVEKNEFPSKAEQPSL